MNHQTGTYTVVEAAPGAEGTEPILIFTFAFCAAVDAFSVGLVRTFVKF